jgi:hypothetical protein
MTGVDSSIGRIDRELAAEVKGQKAAWTAATQANRERGARIPRREAVAKPEAK